MKNQSKIKKYEKSMQTKIKVKNQNKMKMKNEK